MKVYEVSQDSDVFGYCKAKTLDEAKRKTRKKFGLTKFQADSLDYNLVNKPVSF